MRFCKKGDRLFAHTRVFTVIVKMMKFRGSISTYTCSGSLST